MGALFSNSVQKVKYLVAIVLVFIFVLAATVASFIYFSRDFVISLFTEDEEVILGCHRIWPNISIYLFLLYFYCVNSYITRALGQQWRMAFIVLVTLWCITLP